MLGWTLCLTSDRVTRFAALSVGHPASFATAGWRQKELSWYMLWFQFPGIAEQVLPANDWAAFRAWAHRTLPGDHPLARTQLADLARPGALTASLNWYRANIDPATFVPVEPLAVPPLRIPVLGVWSDADLALGEEQMRGSDRYAADFRFETIPGCGHWIPAEAPEQCTELLLEFLRP